MARRLLNRHAGSVLALGLVLSGCRHGSRAPAPAASASATVSALVAAERAFTDDARAAHFEAEKRRAEQRWSKQPSLEGCAAALHGADAELCGAATQALSAVEQLAPGTPPDRVLPVLADGSLSLARLSERTRYQTLVDIGQRRITGDAGAAPPTSSTPRPASLPVPRGPLVPRERQHALELGDSPSERFLPIARQLERDALRNLGAYLEYAPLAVRKSAFETVKRLRDEHPQWPLLEHLIREAALLESDPDLKHALSEFAASGSPREVQPASSK